LNVNRRWHGRQQPRRPGRHARPHDPQNPRIYAGPLHGYCIARHIEQVSDDSLSFNQGTIYPALLRLEQRGWIKSEWRTSETNRRAKFYLLSRIGGKKIHDATENWERIAATMARFLAPSN